MAVEVRATPSDFKTFRRRWELWKVSRQPDLRCWFVSDVRHDRGCSRRCGKPRCITLADGGDSALTYRKWTPSLVFANLVDVISPALDKDLRLPGHSPQYTAPRLGRSARPGARDRHDRRLCRHTAKTKESSDAADPAAAEGTEAERRLAFAEAFRMLDNRIPIFVNLPITSLNRLALQERLDRIGKTAANVD